jgi:hypothetical protein
MHGTKVKIKKIQILVSFDPKWKNSSFDTSPCSYTDAVTHEMFVMKLVC